ncbi:MAG: hypothetical protein JJE17_08685 [Peptostreptococcaceae bacterium]|nr:hypothetical protein [Peptostreptococcaceae bacterium]
MSLKIVYVDFDGVTGITSSSGIERKILLQIEGLSELGSVVRQHFVSRPNTIVKKIIKRLPFTGI